MFKIGQSGPYRGTDFAIYLVNLSFKKQTKQRFKNN